MKKVVVLVSSLNSEGDYLKVGTHPEVDEKTYEKLIGLKNIRDYDEEIDGEQTDDDSELQGKFDTLTGEKDTLQGEFDTLTGEKDTLQGEFDTLTGEKDTLQGEFDTQAEKVTALELDADDALQGQVKTLTEEVVKLKAQLVETIGLKKYEKPAGYEE